MSEFRTSDLPIGLVRLIVAASPVLTDTETTTALSRLRQDVEALETRLTDVAKASRSEYKSNVRVLDAITDYLSRPWWQRLFSRYGGNK